MWDDEASDSLEFPSCGCLVCLVLDQDGCDLATLLGQYGGRSVLCCMPLQDFAEVTFQHLAPVCALARGDALLLLTRHADIFAGRLPRDPCTRVLLPLLARAADQGVESFTTCPSQCC